MGETAGQDLLRRAFDTFNTGDLDACVELLTPGFIANVAGAPEPGIGRDAWKQNALMFREAFADLQVKIEDIFGGGDRVAVRLTFQGTHTGPFFGMPATGRTVAFSSVEIYRVEDGLLAEEWVSPDVTTLLRQISG